MKNFFSLGVIFLLLASTFSGSIPYATQASSNKEILFFEDFERYAAGVFPSAGGWILVWDDKVSAITNSIAVSVPIDSTDGGRIYVSKAFQRL